jgi:TRAP-type mannitol/chloroaromatic compound transport system substrate-binding protein
MKHRSAFVTRFIVMAVSVLFLGVLVPAPDVFAKTYRMKIQSGYPRGDLSMELLKEFAAAAKMYSNGQVIIQVFAEPEIVPGDQLFGAAKQGVLEMVQAMGGYWSGVMPIGNVEFNLPLAFKIDEEEGFRAKGRALRHFLMSSGAIELLRAEYAKHGFYYLDIHTYGPVPFVLSTKAVSSCNDLKGMKIKADGINRVFHNAVGMLSTELSPTETYMSLKLGTVNAAEWDVSAVTGLQWHEVAPYWVRGMESDHTIGHIIFNLKKWNELPGDIQIALKKAAEDYWHATVDAYGKEVDIVENMIKTGAVKNAMLDKACQRQYANAAYEIWKDVAKEDPANARFIELIKEWRGIK